MTLRRTACFVRRPMLVLCMRMTNQPIVLFCSISSVRFVIRCSLTSRANKNCETMTKKKKRKREREQGEMYKYHCISFSSHSHISNIGLRLHWLRLLGTNDIASCSTANEIFLGFFNKLNMFGPTNLSHSPTRCLLLCCSFCLYRGWTFEGPGLHNFCSSYWSHWTSDQDKRRRAMTNKDEQVEMAKLAEQTERYSICLHNVFDLVVWIFI